MNTIHIVQVPIKELKASEYNPRKWNDSAVQNLTESIKRFGLVDPIIVNGSQLRKNIVIGGHFRLKVASELHFNEVPVVYVDILDIEKEKELNLRLNRNTGDWDFDILKDFDVNLLLDVGFDDSELSHIWDEALSVEDDAFNTEQKLQEIKEVKVELGDIYQLGNHRLICGDSTQLTTVKNLAQSEKMNMIYCDPPYNISLNYSNGIGGKKKYTHSKVNDSKSTVEYESFLRKSIEVAKNVAEKDCHYFYWCDESYIGLIQKLYDELEISSKRVCLWIKNNQNLTPQIAFNKVYEPCVYGVTGRPYLSKNETAINEILNSNVSHGNRLIDDVLDLFNIWLEKRLPTSEYNHPTEKPPTLHEKALRRCTKPGDTILDLFGGSGSTLIACEQLNRRCFLAEIDPIFCTLIINRYEELTGKKAQKIN